MSRVFANRFKGFEDRFKLMNNLFLFQMDMHDFERVDSGVDRPGVKATIQSLAVV